MTNDGGNRTTKLRKIGTFGEKDNIKQAEMKEKNLKSVSQENEKTSQNQTTL